jgi:hypothetical protein
MLRGSSSRDSSPQSGSSALAALVLVAIFGFIALTVSEFSGDGNMALHTDAPAQSAQAAGATATAKKDPAVSLDGAARCNAPIQSKKEGVAPIGGGEGVLSVCVPGCAYKVSRADAGGKIDATDSCATLRSRYPSNMTPAQEAAVESCQKTAQCVVQKCDEKGCSTLNSPAERESELGKAAQIPEYFKTDQQIRDALNRARKGEDVTKQVGEMSPTLQEAFKQAKEDAEISTDAEIATNKQKLQSELSRLANATNAGSPVRFRNAIEENINNLEARNEQLLAEKNNLSKTNLEGLRAHASVTDPGENPYGQQGGIYPGTDQPGVDCSNGKCIGPDGKPTSTGTFPGADQPGVSEYCKTVGGCIGPDGKVIPKGATIPPRPQTQGPIRPGGGPDSTSISRSGGSSGGLGGGLSNILGGLLGGLANAFGRSAGGTLGPAQTCSTDPNAYAQQQQQYNLQLQQYNLQLQQYNQERYYGTSYGYGAPTRPIPPQPCTPSTQQQCSNQPPQPPASSCSSGTWKPIQNGACTTSWQCVPGSGDAARKPVAHLSCQPKVADLGMSIAIAYGCDNSTPDSATGFTISTPPNGTATAETTEPAAGTRTNIFSITCKGPTQQTASAQCTVQVAKPSIVLVANPKDVESGEASAIGWITSGMRSCVISSPDRADFTERNAANTSVSGTVTTPPITQDTRFLLTCETHGGGAREAGVSVGVQTSAD